MVRGNAANSQITGGVYSHVPTNRTNGSVNDQRNAGLPMLKGDGRSMSAGYT